MALILCWAARATVINGFYQQHRAGRACTLYLARRGGWAWGAGAGGLCGNVLGIYRGTGMFPVWVSPRIDAVDYCVRGKCLSDGDGCVMGYSDAGFPRSFGVGILGRGTMQFDHLAVSGNTLAEASDHIEQALGVALQDGGQHGVFGTHNRLLGLADGLYLEAIACDPLVPNPGRARWFDLDRFSGAPRLTNWICRCDDIVETLQTLPAGAGHPVDLTRGALRWRMAVPQDGILPFHGAFPALIQWQTTSHPAQSLTQRGCRLQRLTIAHPDADRLKAELGCFSDPRVVFETSTAPGFSAAFDTPHGARVLQ